MFVSRSNKETLKWLKEIKWREISEENLTREADSFFGVLKTKRIETVKVKLADFVKKEHNLRQKIRFQIMKAQKGEGPGDIYVGISTHVWFFPHLFGKTHFYTESSYVAFTTLVCFIAHMCGNNNICVRKPHREMLGFFHTCLVKHTHLLISP